MSLDLINNTSALEIPYRLATIEDIHRAMSSNLLGVSHDYQHILSLARCTVLHHPTAFIQAKKKVTKDFIKIHEEKIRDVKVTYRQVADLPLVDQYALIESSIPWVPEIARHENLFQFLHSFPREVRKHCLLEPPPDSHSGMYSAILAIRRLLRREMVIYLKANKTASLSLLQLKQLLVALTIFDPNNEDILQAFKTLKSKGANHSLQQNAMAELLFVRLPKMIYGLMDRNPGMLTRNLALKLARLNFSSRQIMNLMGYVKPRMTVEDLYKTLDRIDGVATRLSVPSESQSKLHDYIESLKKNIKRSPMLYKTIFLSKELDTCQKLYRSTRIMQSEETLKEKILKTFTRLNTLIFYPTKDYFDFFKGMISHDCTGPELGEKHLLTPQFFNIRIFQDEGWIGNIYMLDFSKEHGALIIDRIQIPRNLNVFYYHFFDHLREVLIEMFEAVDYKNILMPISISNHGTIQEIFNEHRKRLQKKVKRFDSPYATYFESLRGKRTYYILHERSEG